MKRKPADRLGFNFGTEEVRSHPWFENFPWIDLYEKKIIAPYIPKIGNNFDIKLCKSRNIPDQHTINRYLYIMNQENYKDIFEDFTFDKSNYIETPRNNNKRVLIIKTKDESGDLKKSNESPINRRLKLINFGKKPKGKNSISFRSTFVSQLEPYKCKRSRNKKSDENKNSVNFGQSFVLPNIHSNKKSPSKRKIINYL